MVRKVKKFATGGSAKYDAKIARKRADIESDYQKALKGGKNKDVAKAKYEQRMADADDDYAKWTGADRTKTRAAEKQSEATLSEARRTKGASIARRDRIVASDKGAPESSGVPSEIKTAKPKVDTGSLSFGDAFKAARASGDKTFTWKGKSFTTQMAGESAPGKRTAPAAKVNKPAAPAAKAPATPAKAPATPASWTASSAPKYLTRGQGAYEGPVVGRQVEAPAPASMNKPKSREQLLAEARANRAKTRTAPQARAQADESKRQADIAKAKAKGVWFAKGGSIDGIARRGKTRCKGVK